MRKNRATARILILITFSRTNLSRLMGTTLGADFSVLALSSSWVHILSIAATMSVTVERQQLLLNQDTMQARELTFLADKRQTPAECVHKVRKPVRVRTAVELPDVEHALLALDYCRFVATAIEIIRCREKCHDTRKSGLAALAVNTIPIYRD